MDINNIANKFNKPKFSCRTITPTNCVHIINKPAAIGKENDSGYIFKITIQTTNPNK